MYFFLQAAQQHEIDSGLNFSTALSFDDFGITPPLFPSLKLHDLHGKLQFRSGSHGKNIRINKNKESSHKGKPICNSGTKSSPLKNISSEQPAVSYKSDAPHVSIGKNLKNLLHGDATKALPTMKSEPRVSSTPRKSCKSSICRQGKKEVHSLLSSSTDSDDDDEEDEWTPHGPKTVRRKPRSKHKQKQHSMKNKNESILSTDENDSLINVVDSPVKPSTGKRIPKGTVYESSADEDSEADKSYNNVGFYILFSLSD